MCRILSHLQRIRVDRMIRLLLICALTALGACSRPLQVRNYTDGTFYLMDLPERRIQRIEYDTLENVIRVWYK